MDNKQQLYKVRVTTLEKFRRYMKEVVPTYDTEEELIKALKGEFEGNDKTRFGSAFHAIVEHPELLDDLGSPTIVQVDGLKVCVPYNVAKVAHDHARNHPQMICEVPITKVYQTEKYTVQVYGKTDGIEGVAMRDCKTKYRGVSATEYMDSYQWRYYLDMMGLDVFYYDVFEIRYFDGLKQDEYGVYHPVITTGRDKQLRPLGIIQHEPITCTSYMNMHRDCVNLIDEFMQYIETRNFFHLLKSMPYEAALM